MSDKEEKKMKKEKKEKKKKSKAGKVILFLLLIILILAAIIYFGRGFGFGSGGSGSEDGESVEAMVSQTLETTEPEEAVEEVGGLVVIEINESAVKYGDEEFADYASFEEYFYTVKIDGAEYILRDNQAIKSVYDDVKKLLDNFGCTYSEEIA